MRKTRAEAIAEIQHYMEHDSLADAPSNEACQAAIDALRGPSREAVERIRGTWEPFGGKYLTRKKCSRCGWDGQEHIKFYSWCPNCGSPMTDEAVETVLERLEEMYENQ